VYVTRLDPWSVAKAAFLLSLAIGIVIVVAFSFVFWTLDSTGTLDAVSRTIDDVLGTGGFDLLTSLELSRVLGLAAVIASVEIVLVSALATLFAFLYNVTVGLTGGIEVVLSDN
jgi:type III secretory pathway component EscT|tara:strand:+ start:2008 stop:2349 length:342 start_codon:yes stop_codon:yes gene_type:complete